MSSLGGALSSREEPDGRAPFESGTTFDKLLAATMGRGRSFMKSLLLSGLLLAHSVSALAATILVYGDSLSAAYGIAPEAGWVTKLEERLKQEKLNYTVVNASISGETTSGGVARIAASLARYKPDILILALGANDGLRGQPVERMKANLASIVQTAKREGTRVLLVGMRVPPNYGAKYVDAFVRAFQDVAREQRVPLVPFLLEGMADKRELFQDDNIHPTAEAQGVLLDNVWEKLRPMLTRSQ
jgi:acyl-CoA thioesterase-1